MNGLSPPGLAQRPDQFSDFGFTNLLRDRRNVIAVEVAAQRIKDDRLARHFKVARGKA